MTALAVAALVGLAVAGRAAGRSFLSPGAFFSAFWAGIVLLGAIGAPDYETPWIGPAWIALACFAFSAGCLLGDLRRGDEPPPAPVPRPDPALAGMPVAIVACAAMGLAYVVARVALIGPVWSFDEDAPDLPGPYQLLLASHYAGPAFGGLYFASGRKRARGLAMLALVPPAAMALAYVRRSSLLMSGMFWAGGYFAASVRSSAGPGRLVTPRRLVVGGATAAVLAAVAVLFQMFRLQLDGTEASVADTASSYRDAIESDHLGEAWTRVRVILFGYVAPFSHWMARAWDRPPPPTWGAWTFAGPCRLLGLGERVRIDDFELQSGALSNLYTAFYGLVRDFSPLGALAAMFALGVIAGSAYRLVSRGSLTSIPVLIGVYAATIFSPVWSLFRYNALIFGLIYVGMFFIHRRASRPLPAGGWSAAIAPHRGHALTVAIGLLGVLIGVGTFRLAAATFGGVGFGEYVLGRRGLSIVAFPLLMGLGTGLPRFATRHRPGSGMPGPASYGLATIVIAAPLVMTASVAIFCAPGPFAGLVFGDARFAALSRPTLAAIVGLALHTLAHALLTARFRTLAAGLLQLANAALAPALAVVASRGDVARALLALGAITAATSIAAASIASRGLGIRDALRGPIALPVKHLLGFGIPRVPGEFALFGLFALPAFATARRSGVEAAGLLSFGMSLVQLVGSLFAPGAALLLPATGRMLAEGRPDRVALAIGRALGLCLAAAALAVAAFEAALGPFAGLVLGPALAGGIGPARLLLPGAIPYVAYIVLRGPLDSLSSRPLAATNLALALAAECAWIAAGGPPGASLPLALLVLGVLMAASSARALERLRPEEAHSTGL